MTNAAIRAIVFQQLGGRAAAAIFRRTVETAGGRMTTAGLLAVRPNNCVLPAYRTTGLSPLSEAVFRAAIEAASRSPETLRAGARSATAH